MTLAEDLKYKGYSDIPFERIQNVEMVSPTIWVDLKNGNRIHYAVNDLEELASYLTKWEEYRQTLEPACHTDVPQL